MNAEWEEKKLSEIGIVQTGTTPKTSNKGNYGDFIPFIKPADIDIDGNGAIRYDNDGLSETGLKNGRKMNAGSILMVCIGATIGKVGYADREVSCNQQINTLTVNKDSYPKFFYYALTTPIFFESVMQASAQATLPIINKSKWENLTIRYPKSLAEQQHIVSILDEAFASIAKAKANTEKNLQNARELFESYLENVFANPGEGWEKKILEDICEVKDGTHDSPKYVKQGIPFVTQKNIKDEGLTLADTKFITQTDHDKFYKRSNVAIGDILISMIGANRGMSCFVDDKTIFSIKNVGLIKKSEKINQHYLLCFLKSPLAARYVADCSKGGAQEFVGLTALRKFPIVYAPLKEQQAIVDKLKSLSKETKKLETLYQQKLNDLEELKKSILQKAFRGELTDRELA